MLNSFQLLRISAKSSFVLLRNLGDLFSPELNANIKVQRLFYNHLSTYEKKRTKQELINRILIISLIPEILEKGKVVEERVNMNSSFIQITHEILNKKFSVIVIKNKKGHFLLSCFQDY